MKVLLIENDKKTADSLKTLLICNGFEVDIASDGMTGESYAQFGIYDLFILDMILPDLDGLKLSGKLRASHCDIPILMLGECFSTETRIKCLNAGADYGLEKPCDASELSACIHALLRRHGSQTNTLSYGKTFLDLTSGTLHCASGHIRLSAKEFEVMRLLLQNPSRNLTKEAILAYAWGYDSNAVENHVEVYIGFLRKKLSAIDSDIKIVTIRKLGYHLELITTYK